MKFGGRTYGRPYVHFSGDVWITEQRFEVNTQGFMVAILDESGAKQVLGFTQRTGGNSLSDITDKVAEVISAHGWSAEVVADLLTREPSFQGA